MVADDGSVSDEIQRLQALLKQFQSIHTDTSLYLADAHRGKGSIIHEAWRSKPDTGWLCFVDADGSVNGPDMLRLIRTAIEQDLSILGIRKRTVDTHIEESLFRSFFHHAFLMCARLLLGLHCQDPQCGAKIIRGSDYRKVSAQLQEDGLAFDSELLAVLQSHGFSWREIPVNWVQKHGGKVHPFRDGWRMFKALLRIRRRLHASAT